MSLCENWSNGEKSTSTRQGPWNKHQTQVASNVWQWCKEDNRAGEDMLLTVQAWMCLWFCLFINRGQVQSTGRKVAMLKTHEGSIASPLSWKLPLAWSVHSSCQPRHMPNTELSTWTETFPLKFSQGRRACPTGRSSKSEIDARLQLTSSGFSVDEI